MKRDTAWESDLALTELIRSFRRDIRKVYEARPLLVKEHGRQEDAFRTGGYAGRQLLELVQNAADALSRAGTRGRVEVRLTGDTLYCANQGAPLSAAGLEAITAAYMSAKRGDEIGRFGLGFKSVLGICDSPAIFSRSICVGFDRRAARTELARIAPEAGAYPVLRWPSVLEFASELESDPDLADLSEWANTVVRLPIVRDHQRLVEDVRDFPTEFLLFADHVEELTLSLPAEETVARHLRCVVVDDHHRELSDGGKSASWLVWHRRHRPTPEALAEVSEAIRREEVRVSYAAPLDDSLPLGRFWAYFPLQDQTSARGILNAPWRINDDRTNLLPGVFNAELVDQLAQMIVEALPSLTNDSDPARHFDYMPARGAEAQSEGDRMLTELVPSYARQTAVVPDGDARLRVPSELQYLHFELRIPAEAVRLWSAANRNPHAWPHPSCYLTATRRARLRSLARSGDRPSAREVPGPGWLEEMVGSGPDAACRAAVEVVFAVTDEVMRREFLPARVIPDTEGGLHRLRDVREVFIAGTLLSGTPGLRLMRPSFIDDTETVARLKDLGFVEVDPAVELKRLAASVNRKWRGREWQAFWDLTLEVTVSQASEVIEGLASQGADIKVRTANKAWASVDEVVIPGLANPLSRDLAVDLDYHEMHRSLLTILGLDLRPVESVAHSQDRTLREYLRLTRDQYLRSLGPKQPPADALQFFDRAVLGPLHVLRRFGDTGDIAAQELWTSELLRSEAPGEVQFGHINQRLFPPVHVTAPHLWAARRYGLVSTSWGPQPPNLALAPTCTEHSETLPVCIDPRAALIVDTEEPPDLPTSVWIDYLTRTPGATVSATLLGRTAITAMRCLPADEPISTIPALTATGPAPVVAGSVYIAIDDDESRALAEQGLPFLTIDDADRAGELCERAGCKLASSVIRVEYVVEAPSEAVAVLDHYRGLRAIASHQLASWDLISCVGLSRVVTTADGARSVPMSVAFGEMTIMFIDEVSEEDLIVAISERFELGLGVVDIVKVLHDAQDERVRRRVARCKAARPVEEKLLALLPATVLETALPEGLLRTVRAESGDEGDGQVARLIHTVHGYNTLIELKHRLSEEGYRTPDRWAGSPMAVAFVRSLGLPTEYAGSPNRAPATTETVLGPPRLPGLHDYQRELADQVRNLLRSDPPERALLFLPTGAGKTRVTVQAVVESIVAGEVSGPVLWIAQTNELCEQAVQTWHTIWREFGTYPLTVHRLWSKNEVAPSDDAVSVVVATEAKLNSIRNRDDYEWLQSVHAIVLDEAHGATGAGVAATLSWLGVDNRRVERPLLGLTATPFKGRGKEANDRLARRFGHKKLDVLGDDPYGALQERKVLARIEHRVLGGGDFALEGAEAKGFETFKDLPPSVLDRIGRDENRTRRLVAHIAALDPTWPVLVFTPSVLSAQIVAALLRLRGIPAGTVSGTTPAADRRRTIDDFKTRRIRVLTNCSVLTEGFDAPEIRALYIARPTFSPNAYIQMVGRGLRGPANGGEAECLVVNVDDTFTQFGDQLAYQEFEYLWQQPGGGPR